MSNKPHHNSEVIKAWADGKAIQFNIEGIKGWKDFSNDNHIGPWDIDPCKSWRIKPKSEIDLKSYKQAASKAIDIAGKHIMPSNRTSAGLCLMDAIECRRAGRDEGAYNRALESLRHSVGVFHRDYVKARELEG